MSRPDDPIRLSSRRQLRRLDRYLQLGDAPHLRVCAQLHADGWPERIGPAADVRVMRHQIAQLERDRTTLTAQLHHATLVIADLERVLDYLNEHVLDRMPDERQYMASEDDESWSGVRP